MALRRRVGCVVLGMMLMTGPAMTQGVSAGLTPEQRTEVIQTLARKVGEIYGFEDRAVAIESQLRDRLGAGAYDGIDTPDALAAALSRDLYELSNDKHLRVVVGEGLPAGVRIVPGGQGGPVKMVPGGGPVKMVPGGGPVKMVPGGGAPMAAEDHFVRIERLAGNVGYLRFDEFGVLDAAKPTMDAAAQFLRNVDALILDMRFNRGGFADTLSYVAGFFFTEPAVLVKGYNRMTGRNFETWVEPRRGVPSFAGKPLYVLTSRRTGSSGEMLPYALRAYGKAIVVGEVTAGAGNPGMYQPLPHGFSAFIPWGYGVNPVTNAGWEGAGVTPDVEVAADDSLTTAHLLALDAIVAADPAKAQAVAKAKESMAATGR